MLKMAIYVNHLTKFIIPIKFRFQIQFVMFLRGHPRTPIDPAPVLLSGICWDRRQTVNLVSAGGLVEQSNAAKNNAVDKLAGSAVGRLADWLAAAAGGCLASWLLANWLAGCWLAAAAAAGRLGG